MNKKVKLIDLGLCDYKRTWDYQEELFSGIVAAKMRNRTEGTDTPTPGTSYWLSIRMCTLWAARARKNTF